MLEELTLATFVIFLLTQIIKGWVKPKWGDLGVQGFIVLLAFIAAGLKLSWAYLPTDYAKMLVELWFFANGFYQTIGKLLLVPLFNKAKEAIVEK